MKKLLIVTLLILSTLISSAQYKRGYKAYEREGLDGGWVLTISGLAFTTAGILEGSFSYGTWQLNPTPNSPYNQTYVTPSIWRQTPRNIVIGVGITLTFTGLITQLAHSKR